MNTYRLLISIIVCLAAGVIGSIFTTPNIPTWYALLHKPFFSPPNWIFAPVWTTLYILMGISFYIIWEKGLRKNKTGVLFFALQLILNILWSLLFFGLHNPLFGVICIVFLWASILATIITFYRTSKAAGWLLVPYILWVSFASGLNYFVYILNR